MKKYKYWLIICFSLMFSFLNSYATHTEKGIKFDILNIKADSIISDLTKKQNNCNSVDIDYYVHYFGQFVLHPGLAIGIEKSLLTSKRKMHSARLGAEFGGYYHKWNNNSLFLKSSLGHKMYLTKKKKNYFIYTIGFGYLHSFPHGDIYEFKENQAVISKNSGTSHLVYNLNMSFGIHTIKLKKHTLYTRFGIEAFLINNFNGISLPNAAFRLGFNFQK